MSSFLANDNCERKEKTVFRAVIHYYFIINSSCKFNVPQSVIKENFRIIADCLHLMCESRFDRKRCKFLAGCALLTWHN